MGKYQKPKFEHQADDVWAAACAAQRINGRYVKVAQLAQSSEFVEGPQQLANRHIMENFLATPQLLSEQDRERGREVRLHFQGLTFKILQGQQLNDFHQAALDAAGQEVINSQLHLAIIASLPASYERDVKHEEIRNQLEFASGGHVATVGAKVETTVKVVKSVYSHNWGIYFISGLTEQDQSVFFSFKESMDIARIIKIKGTVKAHKGNTTQLNRVKVIG